MANVPTRPEANDPLEASPLIGGTGPAAVSLEDMQAHADLFSTSHHQDTDQDNCGDGPMLAGQNPFGAAAHALDGTRVPWTQIGTLNPNQTLRLNINGSDRNISLPDAPGTSYFRVERSQTGSDRHHVRVVGVGSNGRPTGTWNLDGTVYPLGFISFRWER